MYYELINYCDVWFDTSDVQLGETCVKSDGSAKMKSAILATRIDREICTVGPWVPTQAPQRSSAQG